MRVVQCILDAVCGECLGAGQHCTNDVERVHCLVRNEQDRMRRKGVYARVEQKCPMTCLEVSERKVARLNAACFRHILSWQDDLHPAFLELCIGSSRRI